MNHNELGVHLSIKHELSCWHWFLSYVSSEV